MRIGINTLFEDPRTGTGGLTYVGSLIHALARVDSQNEFIIFVSPLNRHLFDVARPNFFPVLCPFSKERRASEILFEHVAFPWLARRHKLEVFHSPGNIGPLWMPSASVVTIHTVHHYVVPEMLARSSRLYRKALMPQTVRSADLIITDSDFVRNKLREVLKVRDDKMSRVYLGVDATFADFEAQPSIALPEKFILFVSALWPYKNATRLIAAFARLKQTRSLPHSLVIVGSGWESYRAELEREVSAHSLHESVIFTGRVPDVRPYYANADLFVYPSLHEEFGLPLLEAMAAGVPVISSDRGSLPEIAGNAAFLVNPENVGEMAEAIWCMLQPSELRTDMISRGKVRAAQFTWEKTAQGTIEAYQTARARFLHAVRAPKSVRCSEAN